MKNTFSILVFLGVIGFSSCTIQEPGYLTTTPNIPGLSEKGESRCMGAIGLHHVEGQIAVSPVKHLVVLGNLYASNEGSKSFQGGLGLYAQPNANILYESHLVYSKSTISAIDVRKVNYNFWSGTETHNLNIQGAYQAVAWQNGFTFGNGEVYNESNSYLTLGLKYDFVRYDFLKSRYSITKENGSTNVEELDLSDNVLNGQIFTFVITGRTYIGRLGFMGQLAYHEGADRYTSGFSNLPGYNPVWLSFGLELALSRSKHSGIRSMTSPLHQPKSKAPKKLKPEWSSPSNKGPGSLR